MGKSLVVIGNGPSLRGFDFHSIECDTIGMNAAYRHWDQIGWYPTHYCCLDTELINTHHLQIRRLIEAGHVKSAFLSGRMLELHPELAKDPRYFFLDSVHPHWHHHRGKAHGLPFVEHPAFVSSQPGKITTGAHAVRYGVFLGYDDIAIIGVDLRYVEIIPEAEKGDGLKLTIKETPKHNPNYFFDGYQQAGDTYQVPNPASHNGLLHVQAFEALRDDAAANLRHVTITNCNPQSVLWDQKIFGRVDLEEWLRWRSESRALDEVEATIARISSEPLTAAIRRIIVDTHERLRAVASGFKDYRTPSRTRVVKLCHALSFYSYRNEDPHHDWTSSGRWNDDRQCWNW